MSAATPRWTHTCAWDGHELGEMEFVEMSAYERVCDEHHHQFLTWIRDKSRTMYRLAPDDEIPPKAKGVQRLDRVLRLFQVKRAGSSLAGQEISNTSQRGGDIRRSDRKLRGG